MFQKGFGILEVLLVITIVALLSYGGYAFWDNKKKVDINNVQQVESNIKDIRQNPVQLHEIKKKAQDDIEEINKKIASSSDNYLE